MLELKKFTSNERLSEETIAFASDVHFDGKKIGDAKNDGRGGCTMVYLNEHGRSIKDAVEEWVKSKKEGPFYDGVIAHAVDDLVARHHAAKPARRALKTRSCGRTVRASSASL